MASSGTPARNQLLIVATNSFWGVVNFLLAGVAGLVFSVVLARYLGPTDYGRFSYVFSIAAVLISIFNFGIVQAMAKYVPKYFSGQGNGVVAVGLFRRLASLQFMVSGVAMLLAYVARDWWVTSFDLGYMPVWLLLVLLIYIPLIGLSSTYTAFVGGTQNYKKIAQASSVSFAVNGAVLGLGIYFRWELPYFIFINAATNLLVGAVLCVLARSLIGARGGSDTRVGGKEVFRFMGLSYVGSWVNTVVWSYAAVFFLKRFATVEDIGFYSLAVMMAGSLGGVFATSQGAVNNAQFELLEQKQEEKSDTMTYLVVKYSAAAFLPAAILISIVFNHLVVLVYGEAYLGMALVFPCIMVARVVGTIFTPIHTKIKNNNRLFAKMTAWMAVGAGINLLLNYFLIVKCGLIGAGIASLVGQAVTVWLMVRFALKAVRFRFTLREVYGIFAVNLGLAALSCWVYVLDFSIGWNILYCMAALVAYAKALKGFGLVGRLELGLIASLVKGLPHRVGAVFRVVYLVYQKI